MNVVPERCTITVDERTVPGERADVGRVEDVEGVEWTVDRDLPPMQCDDEGFVDAVLEAARDAQENEPVATIKPHATDAGWLAQAGVETIVSGPSEPGEAHTADESASIAVLERCERIYRGVATNWA
jgi:acetylornithine deacetylase